jgi:succinoglycan biosynthesis protein ExoM
MGGVEMSDLNEDNCFDSLIDEEAISMVKKHQDLIESNRKFMGLTSIVMCVCTKGRPEMLRRCLESLLIQQTPEGCRLHLIVIDNNAQPDYSAPHDVFKRVKSDIWSAFFHEPSPGISKARNTAIQNALILNADWIAFIDDDEVAEPDWLVKFMEAINLHGSSFVTKMACKHCGQNHTFPSRPVDAAHGVIRYEFPADSSKWRRRDPWGSWGSVDGKELNCAGTGNVIFRASIVRENGLKFDERLSFSGGEDTDFFRKFHAYGGRIILAKEAIVSETVPWERITLRGHARKSYRNGFQKVETSRSIGDVKKKRFVRQAMKRAVAGVLRLLAAPFCLAGGWNSFMKTSLSGLLSLSEAAGTFQALRGKSFEYYKKTTGY